jgi:hypothetical protein
MAIVTALKATKGDTTTTDTKYCETGLTVAIV